MSARAIITNAEDLGRLVAGVRREHNMSQDALAALVGVSQRYLSELERGKPKVFDDKFIDLLAKLGIQLQAEVSA